ncbi:HDOD domain-containing protein [Herbaspirillum sp. RTI4]|uniref:HDOD domain-containing protein n=1 Tax=Herbaspirillum sp. RTI4 TaxID=3048640 RepID=UPI002AB483BF|nr:HDOD domain-containing protein [Herbaspirillum sp. RTI4]MDY7579471.1 HDOD domain-containing protein [Herbaspirillum sp. RTI4]MEA9980385.1 HDOD domain-containing protein [Herbaspirillum sp. RTI4]
MNFETLFAQQNALPSIPKVVQEVIESFNNEKVGVAEIAHKLAADQVMSAKLLRLANSSYYHVSRSIGTVDDAVLMLGFMTVRTLVISAGLSGSFKNMPGIDLKQFWRYSLYSAAAAKWLAKKTGGNSDFAFTVSMMHGIGQLVMHAAMPEQMLQIDKIAKPLDSRRLDVEKTSFGYQFADVGAELARRWRFPEDFVAAIKGFPDPVEVEPFDRTAAVVHLAAWCARAEENEYSSEEKESTFPYAIADALGIDSDVILEEMPPLLQLSDGLEEMLK